MSKYSLCHKEIPVIDIEIDNNAEITRIYDIHDYAHLPLGIQRYNTKEISLLDINNWWKHRCIPASRNNIEKALNHLNLSSTLFLQKKSMALSLTDHYWVKPLEQNDINTFYKNLTYKELNFFENVFSEDVGKIIFDNDFNSNVNDVSFLSPDNTAEGNLLKKWIINKKNERVLLKGGDPYAPQDCFNEVLASEICKLLNIPCAKYTVFQKNNIYYCASPNYINLNSEFIPASTILNMFDNKETDLNKYQYFIDCCKKIGLNNIEKDICNMIVIDFIMANRDRHYRNFGFIRNPATLKWQGLAPIYDTGLSLFTGLTTFDLTDKNFISSENIASKPFATNHANQIKLVPVQKYCKDLPFNNLNNIEKVFHNIFKNNVRLDEKHKTLLCRNLINRIEEVQKIIFATKIQRETNRTVIRKMQNDYNSYSR